MGNETIQAMTSMADRLERMAGRCNSGMATDVDAQYLVDQVATQPWMTFQGADLLKLHAERIARNGGNGVDGLFLLEFAAWAKAQVTGRRGPSPAKRLHGFERCMREAGV